MSSFAVMVLDLVTEGFHVSFSNFGQQTVKVTIVKDGLESYMVWDLEELRQSLMSVDSFMAMKTILTRDKMRGS